MKGDDHDGGPLMPEPEQNAPTDHANDNNEEAEDMNMEVDEETGVFC